MIHYYRLRLDYLKFTGKDRLDLIHRLSTNDVNSLAKYQNIKTILTSDKGRFVDLITLFNFGDFVFAASSFGNASKIIAHLDKYTIMDDFHVENMEGSHETILFFSHTIESFINEVFGISFAELRDNNFKIYNKEGKDSIIFRNDNLFGGIILIYSKEDKAFYDDLIFSSRLKNKYELNEISDLKYEEMRILNGIPASDKEMTEETNPLECALNKYVSFTKGCYIGQEVIARLDTYDKINKHLVGLKANVGFPELTKASIKTVPEDKECGFVTSYAFSEKYGHIGLGFVKTIFLYFENNYKIITNNGNADCKLVKLPFENLN